MLAPFTATALEAIKLILPLQWLAALWVWLWQVPTYVSGPDHITIELVQPPAR